MDVAVEVYSPRELLAVDAWLKEVSDLLSYVDIQASYSSSVETRFEQLLPPAPRPQDPWATAEMLAMTREEILAHITRDVEDSLRDLSPLNRVYRHPGTPLLTRVELDDVQQAADVGPVRTGTISGPGFSGYSPAGVFRTVVERALKKARKRQTQGMPAAARALVVYLTGTKISEDLTHPAHMSEAKVALDEIDPRDYDLDVIAFVVRSLPQGLAAMLMVWDDTTLTMPEVQAMFGESP
jgi:hypothetical protein